MDTAIHKPGNTVPASGIYEVVDELGTGLDRQVTCEKDESFPPTVHDGEHGFVLYQATLHQS